MEIKNITTLEAAARIQVMIKELGLTPNEAAKQLNKQGFRLNGNLFNQRMALLLNNKQS